MQDKGFTFTPVRRTRVATDVAAQLRSVILAGQFQPGDRLPAEPVMARQFGVSRESIRYALRILEVEGLLEVRTGGAGGPYVSAKHPGYLKDAMSTYLHLQGATFDELVELRIALESTASALAAERATAAELSALRSAAGRATSPRSAAAPGAAADFHTILIGAAHNRALSLLFEVTRSLFLDGLDAASLPEGRRHTHIQRAHTALYGALTRRDAAAAAGIMSVHLSDLAEVCTASSGTSRVPST